MVQCRLDSKSGLSLLTVLSLVLIFRFATSVSYSSHRFARSAKIRVAMKGQGGSFIVLFKDFDLG